MQTNSYVENVSVGKAIGYANKFYCRLCLHHVCVCNVFYTMHRILHNVLSKHINLLKDLDFGLTAIWRNIYTYAKRLGWAMT